MRILHVCDYLMPGLGYQEWMLPLWNAKRDNEVYVITSDRYAPVPNYEESWGGFLGPRLQGTGREVRNGITIIRLKSLAEWGTRPWIADLISTVREIKADVVLVHGSTSLTAFRVVLSRKKLGVPVFIDNHMVFSECRGGVSGAAFYWVLKGFNKVFQHRVEKYYGVAQECVDVLLSREGIDPSRVKLLPLGVDTEIFFPMDDRLSLRKSLGIPQEAIVLLQTGKLTRVKGPDILAAAAFQLMRENENIHLVFLGGMDEAIRAVISDIFSENECRSRLHLFPFATTHELNRYFNTADVVVYPKGASLSALEAAATGTAVVMADLPASQWRANLGVGLTYPSGNVEALADCISLLVNDEAYRSRISDNAIKAVRIYFTYNAVAAAFEEDCMRAMESFAK